MIFPEVRSLYKYNSFSKHFLSNIKNNSLYFSKPENFNDPIDCGIQLQKHISSDVVLEDLKKSNRKFLSILKNKNLNNSTRNYFSILSNENSILLEKIKNGEFKDSWHHTSPNIDYLEKSIKSKGILCLSENNDNMLMWAHYANNHKGLCIGIKREKNTRLSNNNFTLPVRYTQRLPLISTIEYTDGDEKYKREILRTLIYSKSIDWAYEREWRSVIDAGNKVHSIGGRIFEIIFGLNTPSRTRSQIRNYISRNNLNIKLRKSIIKNESFSIAIIDD